MKAILIVSSLIASTFVCDAAMASKLQRPPPEYRAAAPEPEMVAPTGPLFRNGGECGPDRPIPVWGQAGRVLGYECFGNSDMS